MIFVRNMSQVSDSETTVEEPKQIPGHIVKHPFEDYFRCLTSSKDAKSVFVLPSLNPLGDLYLKEILRLFKQLMHFYVGYPEHPRLVVCTQDQILQKYVDDRETRPVISGPSSSEESGGESKRKSGKRPDLPLYVSPALRNGGSTKQNKLPGSGKINGKIENTKNETTTRSPTKVLNFVQPVDDESWKRLSESQLEEIYDMLGDVEIIKPEADECPEKMKIALKDEALSQIVEVFNMNKEIKTKDVISLFDKFSGSKCHLKWVDDERALMIFATPEIAKEALKVSHPVIQMRSLENGSAEAKLKVLTCTSSSNLLPWKERPKTVTTLARRLISSQLGPEFQVVSPEVLQREAKLLREAMAKKREKDKERLARREHAGAAAQVS